MNTTVRTGMHPTEAVKTAPPNLVPTTSPARTAPPDQRDALRKLLSGETHDAGFARLKSHVMASGAAQFTRADVADVLERAAARAAEKEATTGMRRALAEIQERPGAAPSHPDAMTPEEFLRVVGEMAQTCDVPWGEVAQAYALKNPSRGEVIQAMSLMRAEVSEKSRYATQKKTIQRDVDEFSRNVEDKLRETLGGDVKLGWSFSHDWVAPWDPLKHLFKNRNAKFFAAEKAFITVYTRQPSSGNFIKGLGSRWFWRKRAVIELRLPHLSTFSDTVYSSSSAKIFLHDAQICVALREVVAAARTQLRGFGDIEVETTFDPNDE